MRNKFKRMAASAMAVMTIMAPCSIQLQSAFADDTPSIKTEVEGTQYVVEKSDLTVILPSSEANNVTAYGTYTSNAYEVLQMVRPVGDSADPTVIVPDKREGLYCVTSNFVDFFKQALNDYLIIKGDADNTPSTDNKVYLTYDASNFLRMGADKPSDGTIYIEIAYNEYFDESFFAADIISRIQEATAADAVILANWLTKYTKAKANVFGPDKTETLVRDADDKNEIKMTEVVYGYYLIVTTFGDDGSDTSGTVINQSVLDVPHTDSITLKASPITITKTVTNETDKTASASIGDTLSYIVKSKIMDLSNYDLTSYDHTLATDVLGSTQINSVMGIAEGNPTKFHYLFSDTMVYQKLDVESISIKIGADEYKPYFVKNGDNVEYYFVTNSKNGTLVLEDENGKRNENTVTDITTLRNDAFARLSVAPYTADDPNSQFFAINFDLKALKEQDLDPNDITIKYDTWITVDATNSGIQNGASLNYSNNPYDPADAGKIKTDDPDGDDQTHVYTYDFELSKKFSDNSTSYDKLYFELYSDEALKNKIAFVKPDTEDAEGNKLDSPYYIKADQETPADNKTTRLDLGADGKLRLHGLGEGKYYLKEVYVDDGNNSLDKKGFKPITTATITITPYFTETGEGDAKITQREPNLILWKSVTGDDGSTKIINKSVVKIDDVTVTLAKLDDYSFGFSVLNQKGFSLPITGENGNWAFAIIGIILVTGGAVLIFFLFRKKKVGKSA